MRWISVKKRLPEEERRYLVYNCLGCNVSYYKISEWFTGFTMNGSHMITHWMPLPEPPEPDK